MNGRILIAICAVAAAVLLAASASWIASNPLPVYWDEAMYANSAIFDRAAISILGARGASAAFLHGDKERPPALRLLAAPFTMLAGTDLWLLRSISLVGFLVANTLLAIAVSRSTSVLGGAIAFLLSASAPVLVLSSKMFGTEYPLLLALGALLLSLTTRFRTHAVQAVWLACAIGVGLLAKTSFIVVAIPMIATTLVLRGRSAELPDRHDVAIGTVAGVLIAAPWWLENAARAIRFGVQSGGFSRHSLGSPWSAATLGRFLLEFVRTGIGYAGAAVVAAALIWGVRKARGEAIAPLVIIAASGCVLIPLLTYQSSNHNPRLLSTTIFLLAAIAGALAARMPPRLVGSGIAMLLMQVGVIAWPRDWTADDPSQRSYIWRTASKVMAPAEQWDWTALRQLADSRQITQPLIAIVGEGYQLNPANVAYAWSRVTRRADVMLLSRDASRADIIVTAPGFRGEPSDGQPPLNADNERVAAAFSRDPRFTTHRIDVGYREPVYVVAFLKRDPLPRR